MRRAATVLLALGMLTTIPFGMGVAPAAGADGKLDEPLRQALAGDPAWARWADAQGRLTVILVGEEMPMPSEAPLTRAGWRAHWDAAAAPFLAQVRAAMRPGDVLSSAFPSIPEVVLRVAPGRVADLAALDLVRSAGLDWPEAVRLHALPGSGGPGEQLAESAPLIQAPDVWAQGYRGEGVKLAMIDSGIEGEHEAFLDYDGSSRVREWYDVTTNPDAPCPTPCDTNGHGTHTAGTAAGSRIAGGRYDGIAPRAYIIGVRIMQGNSGAWEWAQEGLQAAFDHGADVASNSWGGGCGNSGSEGTTTLVRNLAIAGMQPVFSIGNNGPGSSTFGCPGREDLAISVGATDKSKVIAGFSSRGPCNDSPGGPLNRICPDMVAVGVDVIAPCTNGSYCGLSGTSMSAPQVGGASALAVQLKRALQGQRFNVGAKQLEGLFKTYTQDLGPAGPDNAYGNGFVQLRPMRDNLVAGALARASIGVSLARPEMRAQESNTATITVTNLGAKALTGSAHVVAGGILLHDGHDFGSQALNLAPGQTGTATIAMPGTGLVGSTYNVIATYEYSWDNGGSPVQATISALSSFVLRGAYVQPVRQSFGPNSTGSVLQSVVTYQNVGNEGATSVAATEGVPLLGFVLQPSGLGLSSPAPASFEVNDANDTLDMHYSAGALAAGAQFQVTYNMRNGVPGDYTFTSRVLYTDGAGVRADRSTTTVVGVCVPSVQYPTVLQFVPNPTTGCLQPL